jgi:hypothetical protein
VACGGKVDAKTWRQRAKMVMVKYGELGEWEASACR